MKLYRDKRTYSRSHTFTSLKVTVKIEERSPDSWSKSVINTSTASPHPRKGTQLRRGSLPKKPTPEQLPRKRCSTLCKPTWPFCPKNLGLCSHECLVKVLVLDERSLFWLLGFCSQRKDTMCQAITPALPPHYGRPCKQVKPCEYLSSIKNCQAAHFKAMFSI